MKYEILPLHVELGQKLPREGIKRIDESFTKSSIGNYFQSADMNFSRHKSQEASLQLTIVQGNKEQSGSIYAQPLRKE